MAFAWLAAAAIVFGTRHAGRPALATEALYDDRVEKLRKPTAETIFVGDSSLGNAIDAGLWSELSGQTAVNLALTGFFGYGGSYNMIRRSLAQGRPVNVIVMQTADMLSRPLSERAYELTLDQADLPLRDQLRILLSLSVNFDELREAFQWLWAGRPAAERMLVNDFVPQGPTFQVPPNVPGFSTRTIRPEKLKYLNEIAELCRRESLNCIYVHGPLASPYCERSSEYLQTVARLIRQTGLRLGATEPFCVPQAELGDSTDHVGPAYKGAYTRRYHELLRPLLTQTPGTRQ